MASVIQPTMRASKRHKQREGEGEGEGEKQQLKTRCQTKNMRI